MRRFLRPLLLAATFVYPVATSAQQTPALGDLAVKEQARRRAVKAPAKVLTNEDLPRTAAPQTPAPGAPPVPPAPGEKVENVEKAATVEKPREPEEPAKDQAWWKQRVSQAREELRRNEMFAEALQTRINSLTTDFTARDDPHQRARIAEQRSTAVLELDRVKAEIVLIQSRIDEIEEEARRASVPPGWLR
jgi:hypothetical protein